MRGDFCHCKRNGKLKGHSKRGSAGKSEEAVLFPKDPPKGAKVEGTVILRREVFVIVKTGKNLSAHL